MDPLDNMPKAYDPGEVEGRWYRFWMEKNIFHADDQSDKPPFCIVIPPPNVTGSLHMGHALTITIEDVLIRWARMRGFNTLWVPGTDHAGIATQMVVEREIQANQNKSRHDLGREAFLERVWRWKEEKGSRITEQLQVLGASLDWERERFTMDEGLSRAVREVFVRLHEEGLITRKKWLINWCPRCRTALSNLEVDHREINGEMWDFAYPLAEGEGEIVVSTTRPETMLGDTAIAVHPEDKRYRSLVGKEVVHPFSGRRIPIIADAILADPEVGTGAVKVTPAHDFNDFACGLRHNLEQISIIDEQGLINEAGVPFQGLDRFEARKKVKAALRTRGLERGGRPHRHAVGHCYRCSTIVEPHLSLQWFVIVKPLAEKVIQAVAEERTVFIPSRWKADFVHWMENLEDWCISRQLWWGHRIPAFTCHKGHMTVSRYDISACPECGSKSITQDEDVLDTWFSSALWPFSTLGWPDDTQTLRTFYPNTVMETGFDILKFWVAKMMMMGLHFMGDVPFRTVYLHAMVRDEKGQKMSKTEGNVVDPLDVIQGANLETLVSKALVPGMREEKKAEVAQRLGKQYPQGMEIYGADALRFTLAIMAAQGQDVKLSLDRVAGYRAFINKIWQASRFTLANLQDFQPAPYAPESLELSLADRWILDRLATVAGQADGALGEFRINDGADTLYQFLWHELCDWYIELVKPVLYGEPGPARLAAQATLCHVLARSLEALHPYIPFVTEDLWQRLPRPADAPQSIALAPYPQAAAGRPDPEARARMDMLQEVVKALRNLRGEVGVPPGKGIPVVALAKDGLAQGLREMEDQVKRLVKAEEFTIQETGRPAKAAPAVASGIELFVPLAGLIDVEAEITRLEKQIAKVSKELIQLGKKLNNRDFLAKAPEDVVEKDRLRAGELTTKEARMEATLRTLREAR